MLKKNYSFLFFPVLLLLSCFLLDKVFTLPWIQENFISWNRIEPVVYESRLSLLDDLLKSPDLDKIKSGEKKLIVIFGSSRAASIENRKIEELDDRLVVYNFCVPFPGISYFYYLLSLFQNQNIPITTLVLEVDPFLLSLSGHQYPDMYSYDIPFYFKHSDLWWEGQYDPWKSEGKGFSGTEFLNYFFRRNFYVFRYPFAVKAYSENNSFIDVVWKGEVQKKKKKYLRENYQNLLMDINRTNRGGLVNLSQEAKTDSELSLDAELKFQRYIGRHYRESDSQIKFLKKFIDYSGENSDRVLFITLPISDQLKKKLLKAEIDDSYIEKKFRSLKVRTKMNYLNYLEIPMQCNKFEDGFHLDGSCYSEVTDLLISKLKNLNILNN